MRFLALLALCAVSVVGCAEREKAQEAPPPPATAAQPLGTSEKAVPAKFSAIKDIRKIMPKVGVEVPVNSAAPSASAADAAQ